MNYWVRRRDRMEIEFMGSSSRSSISTYSRVALSDFVFFPFVEPLQLNSLLILHLLLDLLLQLPPFLSRLQSSGLPQLRDHLQLLSEARLLLAELSPRPVLQLSLVSSQFLRVAFWAWPGRLSSSSSCRASHFCLLRFSAGSALLRWFVGSLLPFLNGVAQLLVFLSNLLFQLVDVMWKLLSSSHSFPAEAARVPSPSSFYFCVTMVTRHLEF